MAVTGWSLLLIDMLVPVGSGPPPHWHDFEEMFTLLEGAFKNIFGGAARLRCMCTPPRQEEFFMAIGDPVDARTALPPNLTELERDQRGRKQRLSGPKQDGIPQIVSAVWAGGASRSINSHVPMLLARAEEVIE